MNKQRKVLITTTYNEMGIIIDTKAEEVAQPNLQPICNQFATDTISRQAALNELNEQIKLCDKALSSFDISMRDAFAIKVERKSLVAFGETLKDMPPAQPESCEYYALCRHGRDENKLRVRLGFCEYCNEDSDGYVKPIEKNNHAFVRFGMNGWELDLKANGWHGSAKIRYCPMCGRDLLVK